VLDRGGHEMAEVVRIQPIALGKEAAQRDQVMVHCVFECVEGCRLVEAHGLPYWCGNTRNARF